MKGKLFAIALFCLALPAFGQKGDSYRYILTGSAADVTTPTIPAYLLAGGGETSDDAFRWFLARSGGGDIVVLRASGSDGYHDYFNKLAKIDSVETIIFLKPEAAHDSFVLDKIRHAEALFLAGGDQWNYVRFWKDTPVAAAINDLVKRGVPVGGTSAGLAVLGQYSFAAQFDTVTSATALADPFDKKVSLTRDFLALPGLECLITDSHFSQRDRMGRLLVFLARMSGGEKTNCGAVVRALALDERTAVQVDPSTGAGQVSGPGSAFLLELRSRASLKPGARAEIPAVDVQAVPAGTAIDLRHWTTTGGARYKLETAAGQVKSSLSGGGLYPN